MAVTLTNADKALKTFYLDAVAEQLNMKTNPLLSVIKQSTDDVWGKEVRKLAVYGMNGGVGAGTEDGELAVRYQYDALNRLVREDNKTLDKTYVFVYDNNGNIVKRREFVFILKDNTLIEELESTDRVYIYNGDQMVSYNGQTCVYDVMGNLRLIVVKPQRG